LNRYGNCYDDKACFDCDTLHDKHLASQEVKEVLKSFTLIRLDALSEQVIILDSTVDFVMKQNYEGVRMEACSVATKLFNVSNKSLLNGIKPVGNTFVSLTGYQAKGYASIPIY